MSGACTCLDENPDLGPGCVPDVSSGYLSRPSEVDVEHLSCQMFITSSDLLISELHKRASASPHEALQTAPQPPSGRRLRAPPQVVARRVRLHTEAPAALRLHQPAAVRLNMSTLLGGIAPADEPRLFLCAQQLLEGFRPAGPSVQKHVYNPP